MSEVISSKDFQAKVLEADKPTLVDFFATWCGPCKRQAPVLDEIAAEMGDKVNIYKVDIDQSPDIAAQYKVTGVPTLVVFDNGSIKNKTVGLQPKQSLINMLS